MRRVNLMIFLGTHKIARICAGVHLRKPMVWAEILAAIPAVKWHPSTIVFDVTVSTVQCPAHTVSCLAAI